MLPAIESDGKVLGGLPGSAGSPRDSRLWGIWDAIIRKQEGLSKATSYAVVNHLFLRSARLHCTPDMRLYLA